MNPILKYKDDFDMIVDLLWRIHNYRRVPLSYKGIYMEYMKKELLNTRNSYFNSFSLDKEDIQQELACLWMKYEKQFNEKKVKKTSLRDYLLSCSVWGVKTWYRGNLVVMNQDPCPNTLENPESISLGFEEERCLRLDMSFFQETLVFPLDSLLPYERYLIFLKYKAEKSIVEMAHILQKNRGTVSRQLERIHNKLRSLANEKPENPR